MTYGGGWRKKNSFLDRQAYRCKDWDSVGVSEATLRVKLAHERRGQIWENGREMEPELWPKWAWNMTYLYIL